jgi:hypothetical protein
MRYLRPMRARWLIPAAIFLLIAIGTLTPSSYFLHFDTSNIDVAAADLARGGCWGDPAATLGPVLFTTIPFLIFGSHPLWQTVLLTLSGAVMAGALFRITQHIIGSQRWALIASLWLICLPAILYYTRMHLGFPLMFFVLGIMLYMDQRWWWCGLCFALSVISHFNFSVPSAAFLIFAALIAPAEKRIRAPLIIIASITLTVTLIETIDFLFTGIPFNWVRAVISDAGRLSGGIASPNGWPITHLIRMIAFANGWLHALFLIANIAYPFVRKPRIPIMDAIYLTAWSVFAFYSIRVAIGNTFLTPRMFSAVYPLFVILSTFTAFRVLQRTPRLYQRAAVAFASLLLAFGLIRSASEAAYTSQTGFASIDHAYQQAAQAGLPVRHFGNFHVAYFFAKQYGVETSINESSAEIIGGDTRAVLIFENGIDGHSQWLIDTGEVDTADYEIVVSPHVPLSQSFAIEEYGISPQRLDQLADLMRQPSRPRGSIEVWWPKSPSGDFIARVDSPNYVFYYDGSGCVVSRQYGENLDKNFYNILAEKAVEFWGKIFSGDFAGASKLLQRWLTP